MKKVILAFAAFMLMFTVFAASTARANAQINVFPECEKLSADELKKNPICSATKDKLFGKDSIWNNILNFFTYIVGAVSVLMIIIGGIRYTTSNGDSTQITSAKNTVLYAVIGLVLAIMANAIVNFVLTNI